MVPSFGRLAVEAVSFQHAKTPSSNVQPSASRSIIHAASQWSAVSSHRQHASSWRVATALEIRKTRRPLQNSLACKSRNDAHVTHAMIDQDNFVRPRAWSISPHRSAFASMLETVAFSFRPTACRLRLAYSWPARSLRLTCFAGLRSKRTASRRGFRAAIGDRAVFERLCPVETFVILVSLHQEICSVRPSDQAMRADNLKVLPVSGNVTLATAFGVFLDVKGRRLFVPNPMLPGNRRFKRDQKVTLWLTRGYLQEQGLTE